MDIIDNNESISFELLISFENEISNPIQIKKQIDKLIAILNKIDIRHRNKVISKVIKKDLIKKTITMKIYIPITNNEKITEFLKDYPMYQYEKVFNIKKGYYISISNNMYDFKKAVELFMCKMNNTKEADVNSYDVSNNNNIIEVANIGYDGTVLGFDLYLEK